MDKYIIQYKKNINKANTESCQGQSLHVSSAKI